MYNRVKRLIGINTRNLIFIFDNPKLSANFIPRYRWHIFNNKIPNLKFMQIEMIPKLKKYIDVKFDII